MLRSIRSCRLILPIIFILCSVIAFPPSACGFFQSLTVEKEKELGEEFCLQLQQYYPVVTDPYLTTYINEIGQKLVKQLGPQPFKFRFFILEDPTYNAFAVPGGFVFINTGLIQLMNREDELAGVLAHEITHVHQRHMAKQLEKSKLTTVATVIAALAAVLLGGGAAAPLLTGIMAGGQTAMLAYSREDETEADTLGFKWMTSAKYDPHYMMTVFQKMNRQRWFIGDDNIPVYLKTHPELETRIVNLAHLIDSHQIPDRVAAPPTPAFVYFKQRLEVLYGNPQRLKRELLIKLSQEPNNAPNRYALALVYKRLGDRPKALEAYQQAMALSPNNDLIKRDLAIFDYETSQPQVAQSLFQELLRNNPRDAVSLYYSGLILQDRHQVDEALAFFEKLNTLDPNFTQAYYNLGTLYGEKHRLGEAHYYLGRHSRLAKDLPTALFHFRKALENLVPTDKLYGESQLEIARLQRMKVRVN